MRCAILASGRGSNMEALFQAQERGELSVRFVLAATDKPGASAMAIARSRQVPVWESSPAAEGGSDAYFRKLGDVLSAYDVDLVLLAGFMRILPEFFVERFAGRIMNIHPALLPAFPGLHAQRQAVEYGVRYAGCTVHFVDAGVDTGPIIDQSVVPVLPDDTEETLAQRILTEEHRLYAKCVALYAAGRLRVEGRRVVILP